MSKKTYYIEIDNERVVGSRLSEKAPDSNWMAAPKGWTPENGSLKLTEGSLCEQSKEEADLDFAKDRLKERVSFEIDSMIREKSKKVTDRYREAINKKIDKLDSVESVNDFNIENEIKGIGGFFSGLKVVFS